MMLRAIQAAPAEGLSASDPAWMAPFLDSLAREDLAPATLRGYRYDLRHFLVWHATVQPDAFALDRLAEFELIAYRQHMVAAGRRPATISLEPLSRRPSWPAFTCERARRSDIWTQAI